MKSHHLAIALLVLLVTTSRAVAMTDSDIVVSVKPLHSLVANITKGISKPVLVLSGPASPHAYALKPSNAAALAKAKLIFWIGPQLETFLKKPLATLGSNAKVISFPPDDKDQGKGPHIWLNPLNAMEMVRKITVALSNQDPANSSTYQRNLQNTLNRLDDLDKTLNTQLAQTRSFVVFHNAYSYLAARYNLKIAGVLLDNPELRPSARRISQMQKMLKTSNITCLFSEPQFDRKLITTLTSGTNIKPGTLDPLGSTIPAGPDHYFQMMRQMATTLQQCK